MAENNLQNQKNEVSFENDQTNQILFYANKKLEFANDNINTIKKLLLLTGQYVIAEISKSYDPNIDIDKAWESITKLGNELGVFKEFGLLVDSSFSTDSTLYVNGHYVDESEFSLQDFVTNNLDDTATLLFIVPADYINRPFSFPFWKWVIENKFLHGIVQLPWTKEVIGFTKKGGNVVVISKRKGNMVFFVDATKGFWDNGKSKLDVEKLLEVIHEKNPEYYKEKSFDDIIAQKNDDFSIARQFIPLTKDGKSIVALGDLIDLYDSEVEEDAKGFFLNLDYYDWYYSSAHYSKHFMQPSLMPIAKKTPEKSFFMLVEVEDCDRLVCSYIEDGFNRIDDVYDFSSTGLHSRDVFTDDGEGEPILYTYVNSMVFTIKKFPIVPINPHYLLKELLSEEGTKFLYKWRDVDRWKEDDASFLSLEIEVPSLEQQQRILDLEMQKELSNTKEEIQKNYEKYKQDIRLKKHALAQRLRVMKNWWQNLQAARKDGHGIVDDEATIGKLHPISVKEIYSQIDREMNMLFKQVNAFNLGDTMTSEVFDAKEFVQQYVKQHDPMFEYQTELPQRAANIRFPKDALQIILDNIASNACSHGFKGREKESNIIRIVMEIKGYSLIIRIGNNGNPMSPSMTAEKVFTYGDTTEEGVGEHGGLGGFQIEDLMSKFGNVVELELDENAEFPVVYKLVFRDVNIY